MLLVTDQFKTLGDLRAKADDLPGLRMAVLVHPIGGLLLPEVQSKADGVVPEVVRALTES